LITSLSEALWSVLAAVLPAGIPIPPLRQGQLRQGQLMRWGAAFPSGPGLEAEAMVCPVSRVALCGDAIAGPGFARIEGALRSGEWLAERLLQEWDAGEPAAAELRR
jgi:predicted NAD/FAD-dependent oxidoreductase